MKMQFQNYFIFSHPYFDQPEPVFLNVYGAQESIPRNEYRKPM